MTVLRSATKVRAQIMLSLLALAAIAGCLSGDSPAGAKPSPDDLDGDGVPNTTDAFPDDATKSDVSDYAIPEVPQVDAALLLEDHAAFVTEHNDRADNKPTHESARLALLERFESYGLETYRHNFTTEIAQANIIGIKWGVVRDHWVIVGAHYDTETDDCLVEQIPPFGPGPAVDNPCPLRLLSQGAYDDGSGTMMTVHLGQAFANVTPYYTMAFVAYDGEERGTHGAAAFVRDFITQAVDENGTPSTPYGQIKAVGVLDLDMIGLNWPGVMAPINVLTNSEMAYEVANQKRIDMSWPDEQWKRKDELQLGSSDYARFWSVGEDEGGPIPTIFFIANFEEVGAPNAGGETPPTAYTPFGVYPFWHLQDTVETMTAMAGGQENLEAGFQSAVDVATQVLHSFACQPTYTFDAVAY